MAYGRCICMQYMHIRMYRASEDEETDATSESSVDGIYTGFTRFALFMGNGMFADIGNGTRLRVGNGVISKDNMLISELLIACYSGCS